MSQADTSKNDSNEKNSKKALLNGDIGKRITGQDKLYIDRVIWKNKWSVNFDWLHKKNVIVKLSENNRKLKEPEGLVKEAKIYLTSRFLQCIPFTRQKRVELSLFRTWVPDHRLHRILFCKMFHLRYLKGSEHTSEITRTIFFESKLLVILSKRYVKQEYVEWYVYL